MQYFQNTIYNSSNYIKSVISIVAIMSNIIFINFNQLANQIMVYLKAQVETSKSQVIISQKSVKYYTYYRRKYHLKEECHDKYCHFKEIKQAATKPITKQCRIEKTVKDEQVNNNLDKGSYFIQPELGSFIAILANFFLSKQ